MTPRVDQHGTLSSMRECPTCDADGPHQLAWPGSGRRFLCRECASMFLDTSPARRDVTPHRRAPHIAPSL